MMRLDTVTANANGAARSGLGGAPNETGAGGEVALGDEDSNPLAAASSPRRVSFQVSLCIRLSLSRSLSVYPLLWSGLARQQGGGEGERVGEGGK